MKLKDEIKQGKFRSEHHKAIINIYYTNCFISSQFQEVLKRHKITPQQYNILRILRGQHSKAISMGLIKERMLDKSSDVSRLIERLRAKKFVERKTCKKDRRQMDVKIINAGLDLLAKMDGCEQQMDNILSNLSKKETELLNDILDKIRS